MTLQEEIQAVDQKFDELTETVNQGLSEIQSMVTEISTRHNLTSNEIFNMCRKIKDLQNVSQFT